MDLQRQQSDSILSTIAHLEKKSKLDSVRRILIRNAYSPLQFAAADAYEQVGRAQNSLFSIGQGLQGKLHAIVYNRVDVDVSESDLLAMAEESITCFRESNVNFTSQVAQSVSYMLDYYVKKGEYVKAKYYLENFIPDIQTIDEEIVVLKGLGLLSMHHRQIAEAIVMYKKAIDLIEKSSTPDELAGQHISCCSQLWQCYSILKDYEAAMEMLDKIDEILIYTKDDDWKNSVLYSQKRDRKETLLNMGRIQEAKKILIELENANNYGYYKTVPGSLKEEWAQYYAAIGEYQLALDIVEEMTAYYPLDKTPINYVMHLRQKANLLQSLNRYEEASLLKDKIINISDSLSKVETASQILQMQTILEVEKYKLEKDQIRIEKNEIKIKLNQTYIILVAVSIILILICLFFFFEKRNSKILKEKNRKIFEQYKNLPFEVVKNNQKPSSGNQPSTANASNQIYEKMLDHLLSTEEYLNPDLSREYLALQVGTNRQYLIEAIQENTNMTFGEFISHLRLEYSRRLLLQSKDLTIETILQMSGFSNKATFYRYFSKKYGMTPAEFRSFTNEGEEINLY